MSGARSTPLTTPARTSPISTRGSRTASSRLTRRCSTPGRPTESGSAARSTRTRPGRTASSRPKNLARHYERAGYDVLAITDHWRITGAPNERLLVIPGVELNCILPGARDGHVLGFGVAGTDERGSRARPASTQTSGRHGRLDRGARRHRLPRAPVLDGRHAGDAGAPCERRRNRGLQRGLRARDRTRARSRPLGRAARVRPALPRDRHRRLPSPGLRLRPRVDVGAGARALEGSSTRRAGGRNLLRLHGTAAFRCATRWGRDPGPMQPVSHGHARVGPGDRGGRERRTPRLPVRGSRARMRFGGATSSARASTCLHRRDTPVSR